MSRAISQDILEKIKRNSGICLNIGAGKTKQKNFINLDKRDLPETDIIWDLERFPYPLPDECCLTIVGSHIIEHIKPWLSVQMFDELWRIMKVDGDLALSTPYGGSRGYIQDPTHCCPYNEASFQYFDPDYPLYNVYKPKPWKIEKGFPTWQENGNLECVMRKIKK